MNQPAATIVDLRHGLMADYSETPHPTQVYGVTGQDADSIRVRERGTAFGFCWTGSMTVVSDGQVYHVKAGEYFAMPCLDRLTVMGPAYGARGYFAWRRGYVGLRQVGGPVEQRGRLKYIDGCSDTLLVSPPLKGDPCFNLLHFPAGINQTSHTHPSVRAGLIHGGAGKCITADGVSDLLPGKVFMLAPDAVHAFATSKNIMDLTVFHPDSDFGPTHEAHPMLNRTIVGGRSAAQLPDIRTKEIT